jgi:hypothetical protein
VTNTYGIEARIVLEAKNRKLNMRATMSELDEALVNRAASGAYPGCTLVGTPPQLASATGSKVPPSGGTFGFWPYQAPGLWIDPWASWSTGGSCAACTAEALKFRWSPHTRRNTALLRLGECGFTTIVWRPNSC